MAEPARIRVDVNDLSLIAEGLELVAEEAVTVDHAKEALELLARLKPTLTRLERALARQASA
jgi:hypothetical protein